MANKTFLFAGFFWHKITNLIIGKSFSPLTKIFTLDQKPDLFQS